MNESQKVMELWDQGCNCAQAMLGGFGPSRGLDRDTAQILGRPLGGGVGLSGGICGAVSAAAMVLGWTEPADGDEHAKRSAVYPLVREFLAAFEREHGTIDCGRLLGLDLGRQEDRERFSERNMRVSHCRTYVDTAARLATGLLQRDQPAATEARTD